MGLRFNSVVIDSRDPAGLARFWAAALNYQVLFDSPDAVTVGRDQDTYPALEFVPVPEAKAVKNRLHIDLSPDDRDSEVDRLIGLGATRADVGQGFEVSWVVLADPEGNEFCVLSAREGGV
jgi:hypothetical protein